MANGPLAYRWARRVGAALRSAAKIAIAFFLSIVIYVFASDIDEITKNSKGKHRYGEESVLSVFATLSTLALTLGVALTAALSRPAEALFGRNGFFFILGIYAILSLFT